VNCTYCQGTGFHPCYGGLCGCGFEHGFGATRYACQGCGGSGRVPETKTSTGVIYTIPAITIGRRR
jgi:hypothetical protein